ncbi:saccharopine dehydrogenase NADP-binding domain-containing protein [Salinicola sp. JS01]|uniref:shikimate dehydrogenase family protein n=1 Tax=Salinicola sp. JS01 TaxID=3050071 RepID=UPI00255BDF84|nr:saccharopine dehydrogenase NADP-binding domain-containing protein [Salinicola sp. JS01]WIX33423.1 saccharopine dehydrogenase NADP-binding domain-containing protein [Salinicola sp. JS01]
MQLGLIGQAIQHSSAPDLHRRLGRLLGMSVDYTLFDALIAPPVSIPAQVAELRAQGLRGVNVTYPYKEQALTLADSAGDGARLVRAANTLIFGATGVHAENTDFTGFVAGYRATLGARAPGRVLMLGSGGVGKAVAFGLGQLGAEEILLLDLDRAKADTLAAQLTAAGFAARAVAPEALAALAGECDGLVNCTPIGHEKSPGCPLPGALIRADQWIFDAVYVPARTEFIAQAEAAGAAVISGVSLFVYQGVDAFKLFWGEPARAAEVDAQTPALYRHYHQQLLGSHME